MKSQDESRNWIGSFASTYYNFLGIKMVNGDIKVHLPKDITTTNTTAGLTFTGIYRYNTITDMGFKYATPTLIGTFGDSEQVIKFTPTSISPKSIMGTYVSENPYDVGNFSLVICGEQLE